MSIGYAIINPPAIKIYQQVFYFTNFLNQTMTGIEQKNGLSFQVKHHFSPDTSLTREDIIRKLTADYKKLRHKNAGKPTKEKMKLIKGTINWLNNLNKPKEPNQHSSKSNRHEKTP